jgi:hypothetical protein
MRRHISTHVITFCFFAPNATLMIKQQVHSNNVSMPLLGKHKQTRLHVDSAELCNTARELKVGLDTLEDSHVGEANLSDELEFSVL